MQNCSGDAYKFNLEHTVDNAALLADLRYKQIALDAQSKMCFYFTTLQQAKKIRSSGFIPANVRCDGIPLSLSGLKTEKGASWPSTIVRPQITESEVTWDIKAENRQRVLKPLPVSWSLGCHCVVDMSSPIVGIP